MKATSKHTNGIYQSVVDNGWQHELTLGLPPSQDDTGPIALELTGMSLARCILTICAKIAEKSKVPYQEIEVEMDIEKEGGIIGTTEVLVRVDSDGGMGELEQVLDKAMLTCPVGRLFEEASVDVEASPVKALLASDRTD